MGHSLGHYNELSEVFIIFLAAVALVISIIGSWFLSIDGSHPSFGHEPMIYSRNKVVTVSLYSKQYSCKLVGKLVIWMNI